MNAFLKELIKELIINEALIIFGYLLLPELLRVLRGLGREFSTPRSTVIFIIAGTFISTILSKSFRYFLAKRKNNKQQP